MKLAFIFQLGLLVTWSCTDCSALRDVRITIPLAVQRGHKAVLKCFYNLEGDALYTVKWYKGANEFYRYTPKEIPQIKQFKIKGLNVLEEESNATQVVLNDVQLDNSGMYDCEISADAPSFFTVMKHGYLQVVIPPREDPKITKIKNKYRLNDVLKGECTSAGSRPPANLTWFVNGKDAKSGHIRHNKPHLIDETLYKSVSIIRLAISEDLFSTGRLKIRCSANLYNVYHRSFEMSIELDKPKPRHYITMTTPATAGFSGSNIHQLDTYPHTTFRLSPPAEEETSDKSSRPCARLTAMAIVIFLCLAIR